MRYLKLCRCTSGALLVHDKVLGAVKVYEWRVMLKAARFFHHSRLVIFNRIFHHTKGHCRTYSNSRRQRKVSFRAALKSGICTRTLLSLSQRQLLILFSSKSK